MVASLSGLINDSENANLQETLLLIMHEWNYTHETVKTIPLPLLRAMVKYLNKKYKQNGTR